MTTLIEEFCLHTLGITPQSPGFYGKWHIVGPSEPKREVRECFYGILGTPSGSAVTFFLGQYIHAVFSKVMVPRWIEIMLQPQDPRKKGDRAPWKLDVKFVVTAGEIPTTERPGIVRDGEERRSGRVKSRQSKKNSKKSN